MTTASEEIKGPSTLCTASLTSTALSLSVGGNVTSPSPASVVEVQVPSLTGFTVPIHVDLFFNFLGATQDKILALLLLSKDIYEDCTGIVWTIIPTIYIRSLDDRDDVEEGGTIVHGGNNAVTLFRNVCDRLKNDNFTNPKFQGYRRTVVKRAHKFVPVDPIADDRALHNELQDILSEVQCENFMGSCHSIYGYQSMYQHIVIITDGGARYRGIYGECGSMYRILIFRTYLVVLTSSLKFFTKLSSVGKSDMHGTISILIHVFFSTDTMSRRLLLVIY